MALTAVVRTPVSGRPGRRWWVRGVAELGLLAGLYGVYMLSRAAIGVHVSEAQHRGLQILHLESVLHLDVEQPLNQVVSSLPAVGLVFAYLYATLHYIVTPAVLGWTATRGRSGYLLARNSLLLATIAGLVMYWLLPTAPPRLLDVGLVDTMARFSGAGWWGDAASAPRGMEAFSNQYAAMPSLHVGWAVWVALCLRRHLKSPTLRRAAWAYPALMAAVVMGTANHYLLDVLAGALCALGGAKLATLIASARRSHEHRRTAAATDCGGSTPAGLDPHRPVHPGPRAVGVARCHGGAAPAGHPRHPHGVAGVGGTRPADGRPGGPRRREPRELVGTTALSRRRGVTSPAQVVSTPPIERPPPGQHRPACAQPNGSGTRERLSWT
jgi:membrane-associated phospholipid phosphatase